MTDSLSISEQGLRLIKAFEGFRPVDRERLSGRRVVGYGHLVEGDEAVMLSREEADSLLLDDLAPYEDMLNEHVHAAITQSQFDALASLAFNIGPKSFLGSDVLRAVNAGRPLEAAAGFDAWRLAEIGGDSFVVDALVRRRTAEKALFLRPPEGALSPRTPTRDVEVDAGAVAFDDDPVLDRDAAGRLVSDAPYDVSRLITEMPRRRREDGVSGDLAESEFAQTQEQTIYAGLDSVLEAMPDATVGTVTVPETVPIEEAPLVETGINGETSVDAPVRTAIADAADDVRDRLEALMEPETQAEDSQAAQGTDTSNWPESLITADKVELEDTLDLPESASVFGEATPEPANDPVVVAFPARETALAARPPTLAQPAPANMSTDTPISIDLLDADAAVANRPEVEVNGDFVAASADLRPRRTAWPWVILLAVGGGLFGAGAALILRGVEFVMGQPGRLVGLGAALIGAMIILGALLYLLKHLLLEESD